MELIINSTKLKNTLKILSSVIRGNSILPALGSVKFSVSKETLFLEGSDLETHIKTNISCASDSEFSFLMTFEELNKLCNTVNDCQLVLTLEINTVKREKETIQVYNISVKTPFGTTKYVGSDPVDFPKLPIVKDAESISLDANAILQLKTSLSFTSKNPMNPAQCGICLHCQKEGLNFAATDANMLYKSGVIDHDFSIPNIYILPVKSAKSILYSFDSALVDFNEHFMRFHNEHMEIYSRLIDQNYPQYWNVIPQPEKYFTVDKANLTSAIKYAMLSANDLGWCDFTVFENKLSIVSQNEDYARSGICEPIEISNPTGLDFSFRLNCNFFLSIVQNLNDDVIFHTDGSPTRALLLDSKDLGDIFLITPAMMY